MHAPKMHTPPQGSQPPFQPPGTGSARHPRSSQPRPCPSPCHPCPLPYHGPGSALATPPPIPTTPAARLSATARVAKIFAGFIVDQLLSRARPDVVVVVRQRNSAAARTRVFPSSRGVVELALGVAVQLDAGDGGVLL